MSFGHRLFRKERENAMFRFLTKRIGMYLAILFGVTVIIFGLMMWMPGDPYSSLLIDPNISEEYVEMKKAELGLNDPVPVQYIKWIGRMLHGDLGYSADGRATSVLVGKALKNTLLLTVPAFVFSTLIAAVLGIYSAMHANQFWDKVITLCTFLEVSIPTFFLALFCIKIFCHDFQLLPASGLHSLGMEMGDSGYWRDAVRHMILPVSILTLTQTSSMLRYTRASMLEVLNQDYIRTARAKGVTKGKAVLKHGVYNALLPIITVFCMRLPGILSGALFTETVFVWPGIGTLNYNSIMSRDYAVIITIATMSAVVILAANFLADILYAVADPRIRLEGRKRD